MMIVDLLMGAFRMFGILLMVAVMFHLAGMLLEYFSDPNLISRWKWKFRRWFRS